MKCLKYSAMLVFAGTLALQSMANACIGGNLLQVVTKSNELVASYDIRSGQMVSASRSYAVVKVLNWESGNQISEKFMTNLCKDASCETLNFFDHSTLQVIYVHKLTGVKGVVFIENVSVGPNVPVSRDLGDPKCSAE